MFNRPPARVRRGSISADEPGRASRHVRRRRHHRADDGRPVVPDRRRHRGPIGGSRRRTAASWHRRTITGSSARCSPIRTRRPTRAAARSPSAATRSRRPASIVSPTTSGSASLGALPGRPALRAPRHRAGPQSGRRSDSGVRERQDAVHLHDDRRRAPAEDVHGAGRRLTACIDAYNVLNTRTEIEEFAVTGPLSRTDFRRAAAALDAPRLQAGVLTGVRADDRQRQHDPRPSTPQRRSRWSGRPSAG